MMEVEPYGPAAQAPEGYYTRTQAAALIGRSRDTLVRWHNMGRYRATAFMKTGQLKVWLYSEEDIKNLKQVASSIKVGRPRKETSA